jgi:protein required for attachment to host cells
MQRKKISWIVIADGTRADFLTTNDGKHFETVESMSSESARHLAHAGGADRPGRTHERAAVARHAVEPRHDPHELARHEFARSVVDRLVRAERDNRFDRLVLIAPSHQLGLLRQELDAPLRAKVTLELPKDLVKLPAVELHARLSALPELWAVADSEV